MSAKNTIRPAPIYWPLVRIRLTYRGGAYRQYRGYKYMDIQQEINIRIIENS